MVKMLTLVKAKNILLLRSTKARKKKSLSLSKWSTCTSKIYALTNQPQINYSTRHCMNKISTLML